VPSRPDFEEPIVGLEGIVGPGDGAVGDLRPGVHGTRRQHRENAERHDEAASRVAGQGHHCAHAVEADGYAVRQDARRNGEYRLTANAGSDLPPRPAAMPTAPRPHHAREAGLRFGRGIGQPPKPGPARRVAICLRTENLAG